MKSARRQFYDFPIFWQFLRFNTEFPSQNVEGFADYCR